MAVNFVKKRLVENLPTRNESAAQPGGMSETRIYSEDGWIFREHPGKSIECVGRAGSNIAEMLIQPNLARHDYPSN